MSTEERDKALAEAEAKFLERHNVEWHDLHEYARPDHREGFKAAWDARGQVTPDLAEIKRLAEQDLKCPCCTGYAAILALFNEKGNE